VKKISVARKLSTIEERLQTKFICFGEDITGTEATNPKSVLVSCPGEDFGFRDNFFL
jgi:hypothetical protein